MASSSASSNFKEADLATQSIDLPDGTRVSYVCIPPTATTTTASTTTTTAVVHFGPLNGCAAATNPWTDLWQTSCCTTASLITVDRPGCHETSPVVVPEEETTGAEAATGTSAEATASPKEDDEDWVLQRMRVNTRNVLAVLRAEKIDTVYVLAVCLGHAYAIHFAREVLLHHRETVELKDISLVAPFVSTACPRTWYLARLGSSVPSLLLTAATDIMVNIGATLTPYFLKPAAVRAMLSKDEQADWNDPDDYEQACRMANATIPLTRSVRALEARFGSSPAWQTVIDDFALAAGYGLKADDAQKGTPTTQEDKYKGPFLFPRIKLHASPNDGLVPPAAVEWLSERCYADAEIVWHPEMSSHLTMTLLGGPPRDPRLLQDICQNEFGSVPATKAAPARRKKQGSAGSMLTRGLLLVLLVLACLPGLGSTQELDEAIVVEEPEEIAVDDYLSRLSTEDLQKICLDRGFEVETGDTPLTRDDYVEAARRCLSLEDEMNAILNEHPELAAEVEKEIERLQSQKALLEEERDAMLKEKELLETQLEQAGVDLENFKAQNNASVARRDPADMSFPELLLESFRQLFERVKQDLKFVVKVTQPVWENAWKAGKVGWQHSKPAVMKAWRYSKPVIMQAYAELRKRIDQILPSRKSPQAVAS